MPPRSNPRSTALVSAPMTLLILLLAGCAGPEHRDSPATMAVVQRAAEVLRGSYFGFDDAREGRPGVTLEAAVEARSANGIAVRLRQRSEGLDAREFRITLTPGAIATRLNGSFQPLDSSGAPLGACPLEVTVQRDGLLARTRAETCRFGEGDRASALIKEIAHDGRTLVIGDRVVAPGSGRALIDDRVLELVRIRQFRVRAAVRADGDSSWRVGREARITSDASRISPADAATMPLNLELELAPYRIAEETPLVLRLRAFDSRNGELIAQSWADLDAARMGVAVDGVQIALERE